MNDIIEHEIAQREGIIRKDAHIRHTIVQLEQNINAFKMAKVTVLSALTKHDATTRLVFQLAGRPYSTVCCMFAFAPFAVTVNVVIPPAAMLGRSNVRMPTNLC